MSARGNEIRNAIDSFLLAHDKWVEEGVNTPHITGTYADAMDAFLAVWQSGGVPQEFSRRLVAAIGRTEYEWYEFDMQEDLPDPRQSFWEAIEGLRESLKEPEAEGHKSQRPIESVKTLDAQGVDHRQIAIMWGLVDNWPDGLPRLDLVQKELDTPGSVITDEYVHPADERAQKELEASKNYLDSVRETYAKPAPVEEEPQPGPETSYDLWRLGQTTGTPVSPEQAAAMLCVTVEQVKAEWAEFERGATDQSGSESDETFEALKSRARELGIGFNAKTKEDALRKKVEAAEAELTQV